jgi:PKD repeat protein
MAGVSGVYGESWTTYNNNNTGGAVGNNTVNSSAVDSGSVKWFGTNGGGLAKYDGTTWIKYGTAQGLAGNTVNHVDSDSSGNKWVATGTGLSKYTGSSWTKYTTGNSGLAGNNCLTVATQSTTIWIGTYANGVSKYDGTTWTTYTSANSGLANNRVLDAVVDGSGNKWFATLTGANKYDGTTWAKYTTANSGLANNSVKAVAVAPNGDIWFGTAGGVNKFNGSSWMTYTTVQGLGENDTSAIDVASDGTVWAGHTGSGVSKFPGSTPWTVYTTSNGLANNNVNGIDTEGTTVVWFATGGGGISKLEIAAINPPVADFSGSPTSGNVPLTVNFTDTSTNTPTSWSWTFGDSGTSTAQNPSHQYQNAGTYTVSLTVTAAGGTDTETKTNYITVSDVAAPVANFHGLPTSGTSPLMVNFTDTSTGSITAWSWTFGDSGTSTQQNPSHQYASAGTYTVSLMVMGPVGSDIKTNTNYILVNDPLATVANFYGSPTSGGYSLPVSFTDQSAGNITSWSWSFGDSGTASVRNPLHIYQAQGSYTVSLTVNGPNGSDVETKTNYITVTLPQYEDLWTTYNNSNTGGAINNVVNGAAVETGGVRWFATNGGGLAKYDGTTWIRFTTGNSGLANNTVYATAFDSSGNKWVATTGGVNKYTGTSWIKYTSGNSALANNNTRCIAVDNSGDVWVGTYASGICKFNGSSWTKYTTANSGLAGNGVRGIAVDSSNNKWIATGGGVSMYDGTTWTKYLKPPLASLDTRAVAIAPNGDKWVATLSGVNRLIGTSWVTYTTSDGLAKNDTQSIAVDAGGVVWAGSNGSGVSKLAGATPWTVYNTTNSGIISNTVNAVTAESAVMIWLGAGSNVNQLRMAVVPTAAFTALPTSGDPPLDVNFTDASTGEITGWSWTFGDSGASTAQNPSHSYNVKGDYTVSLTVTGPGGSNTSTRTNYINIITSEPNLVTTTYTNDTSLFANTERGWVWSYPATYEDQTAPVLTVSELQNLRNGADKITLVRKYYQLRDFLSSPISDTYLDNIRADLQACRDAGVKMIPRFVYVYVLGYNKNDAPLSRVQGHIDQLEPIFEDYMDAIAFIEMGLVGWWGEWHDSYLSYPGTENTYVDNWTLEMLTDGVTLRNKMLTAVPPQRMVQMRRLYWYKEKIWSNPVTESTAYNQSTQSRIGYHNDGVMDLEQWIEPGCGECPPYENSVAYAKEDSNWTVYAGEPSSNEPDSYALRADPRPSLRQFHWSALMRNANTDENAEHYTYWKNQGYFDDLTRYLGYRFRLTEATVPEDVWLGDTMNVQLKITNDGYAAPYNERSFYIVLRPTGGGDATYLYMNGQSGADPRYWLGQTSRTLNLSATIPSNMTLGTYDVLLYFPDPESPLYGRPEFSIRLASLLNGNTVWESNTGFNKLGMTVQVRW